MLLSVLARGAVTRRLIAAGALTVVAALLPACSGESSTTTQQPATASAPADPAQATEVGKAATPATPIAPAPSVAKPAEPPVASAKDKAAQTALNGTEPGLQGQNQASGEPSKTAAATKTAEPGQPGHNHTPESKAAAAKQAGDPMQDVDPNSKARVTYEFGSDVVNFGKVMQGDVLLHKFQMQSSGEDDLIIKQAKPTCGCTVAQIMAEDSEKQMVPYQYGKPLPPGRKIEIGATLQTQNKRGHAGSKINIFTNDPRGQTILSLEADVEPFFSVNPPSINFQNLSQKDTATDKLTVTTTKGQRVKLTAGKDNMPQALKVELKPLDEDADGKSTRWELIATAGPGLLEGSLAYPVQLKSDLPIPGGEKLPNGTVPTYEVQATVMARVTGALSYNPQFVSLGLIRPGQTMARSVRVTSHDSDFRLGTPEVLIQGRDMPEWEFAQNFSAVVRPVANENAVDVEVTLNGLPDTLNGSFSGKLVIKLGHPDKPEITVPITGVCRGGAAVPAAQPAPK